jgi:hypothetical protein
VSLQIVASDPDGDPLTWSASGLPPSLTIGTTSGLVTGTLASGSANGSPYAVTVTVSDGTASAVASFTWNVTTAAENQPPVAVDDRAVVVRGGSVTIDLLANDYDPDGSLDTGSVVIVVQPRHGTVSDAGGGNWIYRHSGSNQQNDRFDYTVRDNLGAVSNVAAVRIKGTKDSPSSSSEATTADFDGDGWIDTEDPFPLDADNGRSTTIPLLLTFPHGSDAGGLLGLGFTGLMSNGRVGERQGTHYLDLYDADRVFPGNDPEHPEMLTIADVDEGDARGELDSQTHAFQLGIDVDSSNQPFVLSSELRAPWFGGLSAQDGQSQGIYIGRGDQQDYLKLALDGGSNAMELLLEVDGNIDSRIVAVGNPLAAQRLTLYLVVDPQSATARALVGIDNAAPVVVGELTSLPRSWFTDPARGLAIGIIASSGEAMDFAANWARLAVDWLAADVEFELREDSAATSIDVRANDMLSNLFRIAAVEDGDRGGTVGIERTAESDTLLYTPAADFAGIETLAYRVDAGIGIAARAVVAVRVTPVNDPPAVSVTGNLALANDARPREISSFATFLPGGGADEATQQVAEYIVTNDNAALFRSPPAIDKQGVLRFQQAAPLRSGVATVTVKVRDDGGTANGGNDTSEPVTFTLTLGDAGQ